jgi:hypothetical protein
MRSNARQRLGRRVSSQSRLLPILGHYSMVAVAGAALGLPGIGMPLRLVVVAGVCAFYLFRSNVFAVVEFGLLAMPFETVSLIAGDFELTLPKLGCYLIGLHLIVYRVPAGSVDVRSRTRKGTALAICYLTLVCLNFGLRGAWTLDGLKRLHEYLLPLVLGIGIVEAVRSMDDLEALFEVFSQSATLIAAIGLAQWTFSSPLFNAQIYYTPEGYERITSVFHASYECAVYLLVALWITAGRAPSGKSGYLRARIVILLAALLLTWVRAALIGLMLGIGALYWFRGVRRLVGVQVIVLCLAVAASGLFLARVSDDVDPRRLDTTTTSRLLLMQRSAKAFEENPVFGVGVGKFYDRFIDQFSSVEMQYISEGNINAHNVYIQTAATFGLIGLLCFVSALAYLSLRLRSVIKARNEPRNRRELLALSGALFSLIFLGLFVDLFLRTISSVLFTLVAFINSAAAGSPSVRPPLRRLLRRAGHDAWERDADSNRCYAGAEWPKGHRDLCSKLGRMYPRSPAGT